MKHENIISGAIKLASSAVCADLFYIIIRIQSPAKTAEDVRFLAHVPQMLEHMLLCTVIIAAFGALAHYVVKSGGR